ncbi:reverse transcriptase domain-containing protein [Tanacetum coccineum]
MTRSTVKRLTKPLEDPEREFRRRRKAALRSHQNESLAIAERNLFADEASSSYNIGAKPPMPPNTLHEHSHPNSFEGWNRIEEYVKYQDDPWDDVSPPMIISSISEEMQPTLRGRLKRDCNQISYLEKPTREVGLKTPYLICDHYGGSHEADECKQTNQAEQVCLSEGDIYDDPSLLRFYQNDDTSPWGNNKCKEKGEDALEWIIRSKFEDELANFMLEKKSHAKRIGDMLDQHHKELRISTQDPPFLALPQPATDNFTEGETEKGGPEGAEPSIIQEPAPQPSILYQPSKSSNLPFPSRLKKQKKDDEDERFLSIFKQIHINLPFVEAMIHMPRGAKVLKDLLSYKEKLEKAASSVKLSEECSAIIQRSLPQKEGDPGSFTLSCLIGPLAIKNALTDLGASINIMPHSLFRRLGISKLKPTQMKEERDDPNEVLAVSFYLRTEPVEPLEWKASENRLKPSRMEPPKLELKELPKHLKYAFLQENNQLPVVISSALSTVEKTRLLEVLRNHKGAIAWSIADIKGTDSSFCTYKILMEDEFKPSVQPQRRVSPVQVVPKKGGMTVVKNEKDELIPQGTVTGWRVCIDYHKLNNATRKDHFPLSFIDQMLKRLAGHEYYCFLDGFFGYFQIPIAPEDQEKTMFTCPYRTFPYKRMPFGLCNAMASFQRYMIAIFHELIEDNMEVFMDDFSVSGSSFDHCLKNLEKMLKRYEETILVLNWEKCHFMVKEGIVLGHKVSGSGIEVDKAKIKAISKLPYPTNVKAIRSFLGHVSFYRRFIKDFSQIACPMTQLLVKDAPFNFSEECI